MLGAASALYHSGKGDDSKIPKKINAKEEMAENDKKKKKKRIENAKTKQKSFQQPDNASGSFKSVLTGKNIVCYVI